jgi:hypothetical protein
MPAINLSGFRRPNIPESTCHAGTPLCRKKSAMFSGRIEGEMAENCSISGRKAELTSFIKDLVVTLLLEILTAHGR